MEDADTLLMNIYCIWLDETLKNAFVLLNVLCYYNQLSKSCSQDHVQVRSGVKPSPCRVNEPGARCSSGQLMSSFTQPYHMTSRVTWPARPCVSFPESSEYFIQLQINSNQLVIRAQAESVVQSLQLIKPFRGDWARQKPEKATCCGVTWRLIACVGSEALLRHYWTQMYSRVTYCWCLFIIRLEEDGKLVKASTGEVIELYILGSLSQMWTFAVERFTSNTHEVCSYMCIYEHSLTIYIVLVRWVLRVNSLLLVLNVTFCSAGWSGSSCGFFVLFFVFAFFSLNSLFFL